MLHYFSYRKRCIYVQDPPLLPSVAIAIATGTLPRSKNVGRTFGDTMLAKHLAHPCSTAPHYKSVRRNMSGICVGGGGVSTVKRTTLFAVGA